MKELSKEQIDNALSAKTDFQFMARIEIIEALALTMHDDKIASPAAIMMLGSYDRVVEMAYGDLRKLIHRNLIRLEGEFPCTAANLGNAIDEHIDLMIESAKLRSREVHEK